MTGEEFLEAFSSRTAAYIKGADLDQRPVAVLIGESAHTPAGHLLAISLFNQLARAHRSLVIIGDLDRELLCRDPLGSTDLGVATAGLARAINPFIEIETVEAAPGSALLTIGLGVGAELQVGCEGWIAHFGENAAIGADEESLPGASLAACLAAAVAFHRMMGNDFTLAEKHSLWVGGAESNAQGPPVPRPLDLGHVLQVGAGAVGAALDYWLAAFGRVNGGWLIVDHDLVDASNLNRQLTFRAEDAGYPVPPAKPKAEIAAGILGAEANTKLWGQDPEIVEAEYDLVLALANESGVRPALQARQQPILLHATTSPNWQAQAHRHIRGRDDCISCRLPGKAAELDCTTVEIRPGTGMDAALPFLSASAGLLLARDLIRLATGTLEADGNNFTALDFGGALPVVQEVRHVCRADCRSVLPPAARSGILVDSRFARLDAAVC